MSLFALDLAPERRPGLRFTKFTDYSLRVLILAASDPERNFTITEAAESYGISAAHLKKVVRTLSREGYLRGTRGRSGGFRLALRPEDINLGTLIRLTESDFAMVECLSPENTCPITSICKLPNIIDQALHAMLDVFDGYTLADILLESRFHGELRMPEGSR